MKPETLAILASQAIVGGTSLTLSIPSTEKWPKGWPRGELMSVNDKGIKNYSFDPLKVLAFMQKLGRLK